MTFNATATPSIDADSTPTVGLDTEIDAEQQYRASAYGLLAALLRQAPDQAYLDQLAQLPQQDNSDDELLVSMSMLGLSAKMHQPESLEQEYHDLFIGLGKGEIVPYASWYLTGFLMEQPLSDLRQSLSILGYERQQDVHEPEDHAAALCEVMSMLILEQQDFATQQQFFEQHIQTWMNQFFIDLSVAQSAVFYRALGRFGQAFIAFEDTYFSMPT